MLDDYAAWCVEKSSRIAIDFNHSGEVYIISEACVYTLHTPRIGSHAAVLPPLLLAAYRSYLSANCLLRTLLRDYGEYMESHQGRETPSREEGSANALSKPAR
jgi:hypothetical protein